MAVTDGINPELMRRFLSMQAAAAAAGFSIGIGSGYRTPEQQAALRIKNGCPDVYQSPASSCRIPTAIPGRSNHNHGLAIDVSANKAAKAWMAAHIGEFGLGLPVEGEDWHVELAGSPGHYEGAGQMGGIGLDINWLNAQRSREEVEDDLISGYMDAMVGAQRDALVDTPDMSMLETPMPEAIETPALAQDFSPEGAEQEIRTELVPMEGPPGTPAAPAAGGGQWQGNTPPAGYVPPGKGVGRWRDVAIAALRYTGQDPGLVDVLLRRMAQESGGDPRAVNNWDINAKNGDPSKGLMQNIGSAFPERARELANRGIFDGFANIVASIRYSLSRYGSLTKAWNRPGGY